MLEIFHQRYVACTLARRCRSLISQLNAALAVENALLPLSLPYAVITLISLARFL